MSGGRGSGFTVLELVVSLALTSVIMLVGFQLVAESITLFRDVDRAVKSSPLALAMATVRRDIQGAGIASSMPVVDSEAVPLELISWDNSRVRLILEGDSLVRYRVDGLGQTSGRRILLRGVTSWWWHYANNTVLEVRVTVLNNPDTMPDSRRTAERRTEVRRFAMRGTPDGLRW